MRFSHKYNKMPVCMLGTRVLEVFYVDDISKLSAEYIEYDTKTIHGTNYALPTHTPLLIILLISGIHVWTTVRAWTAEKEKYYSGLRGKLIKIEVAYDF